MGRLEIIHDDKVIFDYPVDSITWTEHADNIELAAAFNPPDPATRHTGPMFAAGPAVGNLPGGILGEPPPGWSADDPDPEIPNG